jgi:hypothetical protein
MSRSCIPVRYRSTRDLSFLFRQVCFVCLSRQAGHVPVIGLTLYLYKVVPSLSHINDSLLVIISFKILDEYLAQTHYLRSMPSHSGTGRSCSLRCHSTTRDAERCNLRRDVIPTWYGAGTGLRGTDNPEYEQ